MNKKKEIKKIALLSLLLAVSIIFSYIETFYFPKFPVTGTLELHFFPLFLVNYLFNEYYTLLLATILWVFNVLFVPSSFIVSIWSFLLDYILPTYSFCMFFFLINFFFKKNYLQTKTISNFYYYFLLVLAIFAFKLLCNTISGHLFFHVSWWKALLLNSTYNLVTFVFFLVIFKKHQQITIAFLEKKY